LRVCMTCTLCLVVLHWVHRGGGTEAASALAAPGSGPRHATGSARPTALHFSRCYFRM
jgi:hypothetical protein